jgi:hypothetical protein
MSICGKCIRVKLVVFDLGRLLYLRRSVTFCSENLRQTNDLEELRIGLMIIINWILKKIGSKGADGIHLAQCRDLLNTVRKLRVP